MKMKMPPPRGFDQQERNTLCVRCGAPMFNDVCSRCGTRRPTKGPVDLIKKSGGGQSSGSLDFRAQAPLLSGSAVSTSNADTTVTISNIVKPAGSIIFVGTILGFAGSPGANSSTATFAGNAITLLSPAGVAHAGNTYRTGAGEYDHAAALTGDLVVTWTGVIPDCKAVQYWVLPGSAFDFLATPIDAAASTPSSFTFFNGVGTPPPTSPPSPIVFWQAGLGPLTDYSGSWVSGLLSGTGVQTGGSVPVALSWASAICLKQDWTVSRSGFATTFYWVKCCGPLP